MKSNQSMIDMWTRAADAYEAMPGSPAEVLAEAGLSEGIQQFKLGHVDVVAPGHEKDSVAPRRFPTALPAALLHKFRRLASDDLPFKYDSLPVSRQHLFNVSALHQSVRVLVVGGTGRCGSHRRWLPCCR